jgi:molybdate transport system substrate-binding protein
VRRRLLWIPLLLAIVLLGNACAAASGPATTTAPKLEGSITVFAASSLTDAFNDLAARFQNAHPGVKVTFSFAASSTLAGQVNQGAPADVLATADEDSMQTATKAGNTTTPVRFARNVLRIIVAKGNPKGLTGLRDISHVTYALCDPSVPCGKYAALAFKKNGVTASPDSYEINVKAVVARVTSGELDAGVVYRTDVFAARSKADGVDVEGADEPDLQNIYPIALTTRSKGNALARAWVAYVTSTEARAVLASYEFLPPPG